jgi:hypothetical protein
MARRRKSASRRRAILILVLLCALAAALWHWHTPVRSWLGRVVSGQVRVVAADSMHIDAANEAAQVRVSGQLTASGPARDLQLGVSANAAVLLRRVEMYQWQEHCTATACRYDTGWSAPVNSRKFRDPHGHQNPPAPFVDATFAAPDLRLGAFAVNVALPATQLRTQDFAAHATNLPPNLAASFGEADGMLYAGGDPAHPQVGVLRVSYRVIPLGAATLTGVQRGDRLTAH